MNLLELRKQIKSKKPDFIRQQYNKKKSLGKKWRKPKGMHSKLRLNKRGHIKKPSPGYCSPKKVKNLHQSGLKIKLVKTIKDLEAITKDEGILLSSTLGLKKKLQILEKIKELKLPLLNIKDIDSYIKNSKEKLEKRKQESKKKEQKIIKKEIEKKKEKSEEEIKEEKKKEEKELAKKAPKQETQKFITQKTTQQISRPSAPKQK